MKKVVIWKEIKDILDTHGIPAKTQLGYSDAGSYYYLWLSYRGREVECRLKKGTIDALDFENNYKSCVKTDRDYNGKIFIRTFSGDQASESVSFTTRGDDIVNDLIGQGVVCKWDASKSNPDERAFDTTTSKTMDLRFTESGCIVHGKKSWLNGDGDCYGDCYIICPAGCVLGLDENSDPIIAPVDYTLSHYVIESYFDGDCPGGTMIQCEGATDSIPFNLGWILRIIINKPAGNVTFRGNIEFAIYRASTVD